MHICIYIVSYILVCYLCIMLERNLIRTYIWTYISSVEFVYEKLIKTKKEPFSTGWKHQPGTKRVTPVQCSGGHLVPVGNSNQD
jgi:hypothetical protein